MFPEPFVPDAPGGPGGEAVGLPDLAVAHPHAVILPEDQPGAGHPDPLHQALEGLGVPAALDLPLPERFLPYEGRAHRAIAATAEFPFEDAPFEVVMMEGSCARARAISIRCS